MPCRDCEGAHAAATHGQEVRDRGRRVKLPGVSRLRSIDPNVEFAVFDPSCFPVKHRSSKKRVRVNDPRFAISSFDLLPVS